MSEHKRREAQRAAHDQIATSLVDKGLLISAGFSVYRRVIMSADAGPVQVDETRRAFFAGAQHLLGTIMSMLGPEAEPTERDLRRMNAVSKELQDWADLEIKKQSASPNPGSTN